MFHFIVCCIAADMSFIHKWFPPLTKGEGSSTLFGPASYEMDTKLHFQSIEHSNQAEERQSENRNGDMHWSRHDWLSETVRPIQLSHLFCRH